MLEVERDSEPISGCLWPPGEDPPLVFSGWIQLAVAIEALRTGGYDDDSTVAAAGRFGLDEIS